MAALRAGFLEQRQAVVGQADLVADVIEGAHGVLEGNLARLEGADAVQGGVPHGNGLPDGAADAVGASSRTAGR